jgi:hypothetical protein
MPGSPDIYSYDPMTYAANVPNINDIMQHAQLAALQQGQLGVQQGQLALAQQENAAKVARQQAYQSAVSAYQADPSAPGFQNLVTSFPEFADALGKGYDINNAAQNQQKFQQMTGIFFQAQQDPEKAAETLEQIAASDPGNSQADLALAAQLRDPNQRKAAMGQIFAHAYAVAGDKPGFLDAAKEYFPGAGSPGQKDKLVNVNGIFYDTSDPTAPKAVGQGLPGSATYTDANGVTRAKEPVYGLPFVTPNGLVQFGDYYKNNGIALPAAGSGTTGGTPAVAAAGEARAHGWTPLGNGNTRSMLDNKEGVISKATGFGIDQPYTAADIPKVMQAYSQTEKGIGATLNNPLNIQDGAWAKSQPGYIGAAKGYAHFDTPQNGMAAAVKLATQKFNSYGQNTIRSLTEGAPSRGMGGHSPAQVRAAAQRAIARGADPNWVRQRAATAGVTL